MSRNAVFASIVFLLSCNSKGSASQEADLQRTPSKYDPSVAMGSASASRFEEQEDKPAESGLALDEGKMGKRDAVGRAKSAGVLGNAKTPAADPAKPEPVGTEAVATRAWFPETFLFQPLVVTDDNGDATVPVKVPDRLTTWRVLALAHSRGGAQGGATTSFLGTLPTYVDPVIPAFLTVGDKIRLPIQLVNTTAAPVTGKLETAIEGGTLAGAAGTKTVPAGGNLVEYAELTATKAGTIKLGVRLAGSDAVERTIDVVPSGRPVTVHRSGTLAAPRTLTITGPERGEPSTDRARLLVFPGALALLRSELAVSTSRAGVAEDAYAMLLAGKAPALLAALGDKPDVQVLRDLSVLTTQRAIRHGRTLDIERATLIAEAALAHRDNPVLARLGERATSYLAQQQRPDGSFSGATGWTLQRVLIATADATRAASADLSTSAARQRAQGVRAKASGVFARTAEQVTDPYTAAAILASGAVEGALADTLRARVLAGIQKAEDGARYLAVGEGVVRADGLRPTTVEATALAVLALGAAPDAQPVLADLGTTLLGGYSPLHGWGDGVANLACMRAVLELFKAPLPASVKITLALDGKEVASGELAGDKLKDVLALDVGTGGFAGSHQWTITAEPAVPGLGYSLALHSWVPWDTQTTQGGLELQLPTKVTGAVGKPIELAISAIAPSGRAVHVRHALPAGVQVDRPSLEALVTAGQLERFDLSDGMIDLHLVPLQPGQVFSAKYKVVPTLAGTLRSQASVIETGPTTYHVPPTEWTIR